MKNTSKTAAAVLDVLTDGLNEETRSKKMDFYKGSFMPVSVEYLHETSQGKYFSVCHYYEQNGDLMRDPEIVYLKVVYSPEGPAAYFPVSFRQDNLGIDREYCKYDENGKIIAVALRWQADTAAFSTMWMNNIKHQQCLIVRKKAA